MTVEIPLTKGYVALVDADDAERVLAAGRWYASECDRHWYARRSIGGGKAESMHTFLTGWPLVDHRNGDGLDNRRGNLRAATPSQNSANQRRSSRNTSGYKGVNFYRRTGRWRAHIGIKGRHKHLGYFDSAEEAARVYDATAIAVYGEFARPNFPQETAST